MKSEHQLRARESPAFAVSVWLILCVESTGVLHCIQYISITQPATQTHTDAHTHTLTHTRSHTHAHSSAELIGMATHSGILSSWKRMREGYWRGGYE